MKQFQYVCSALGFFAAAILNACGPQVGVRAGAVATLQGQNETQGFFPEGSTSTLDSLENAPLKLQLSDGLGGRREFSESTREFRTVATVSGFTDSTNENQSRKIIHRAIVVLGGQTVFDETQRGNAILWSISFEKEGNYIVSFSARSEAAQIEVKLPEITYKVDRTAPQFDATIEVNTELSTGKRNVNATVESAGGERLKCSSGWLYADAKSNERSKMSFEAVQIAPAQRAQVSAAAFGSYANALSGNSKDAFRPEDYSSRLIGTGALPNIWKEAVFAEVSCADISGNATTRVFPLYSESHQGVYSVEAPYGKAPSIGGTVPVVYVKSSNFSFKTSIVSKETGLAANQEMLSRFATFTKVVVSDAPVLDFAAAQANGGALIADFGTDINFPIPSFAAGSPRADLEQTLYVSFFEKSRNPAEQSLPLQFRMSEKLTLKFDDKALQYEWNPQAIQKIIAKKDEFIALGLKPLAETYSGAALHKFPSFEWSVNGTDWLPIESFDAKIGENGELTGKVKYPFEKEQAFRVRAKVIDRAGNEWLSLVSPVLVYPENLAAQFALDPACVAGDDAKTPLSKPDLVLASSYACKVKSAQASDEARWRIQVFALNRGRGAVALQNPSSGLPKVFSNVSFLFKASKETFVSPLTLGTGSSAATLRMSTLENLQPVTVEIPEDELFSAGARLYFDAAAYDNSTGYTFSTAPGSTCYLNSPDQSFVLDGRPRLILNPISSDQSGSMGNVKRSPFDCVD